MYVTAARAKTGPEWAQGTALQLVLQLGHLARPPAAWLLQQPWAQPVIRMGSLLARPIEGGMPLLFLVPCWLTRSSAVFVLMSMHLGVLLLVYLTDIPMINITVLIALLPGQFWDHLNARLPCQRHRALLLIRVQCTLERLTKTKQKVDVDIPKAPPDPVLARLSPILPPCGQLLVLLITFHLMGDQATMALGPGWWTPTQTGRAVAKNLRLDAAWAVFAPGIQKVDWWITAPAQLGGSSKLVDLFPAHRGAFETRSLDGTKRSECFSSDIRSHRWAKYWENFVLGWSNSREKIERELVRSQYGRFICNAWNGRTGHHPRLVNFTMVLHMMDNTVPRNLARLRHSSLHQQVC